MRTCLAIVFVCVLLIPTGALSDPGRRDGKERERPGVEAVKKDRVESLRDRDGKRRERATTRSDEGPEQASETAGLKKRGRQSALDAGTSDGDDASAQAANRVLICHKPGTPAERELLIPEAAVPRHLGHGDTLGACPGDQTPVE